MSWAPFIGMIVGAAIGLLVYIFSNRFAEKERRRRGG